MQLIALACIFVASKFTQNEGPSLSELCQIGTHARMRSELKAAELQLLATVGSELHVLPDQPWTEPLVDSATG